MMKQKEVEKKFQEFFSFNPQQKAISPQQSKPTNNKNLIKKESEKNEKDSIQNKNQRY